VSFLDAYRAAELDPETRARFERHLAECAHCAEYLASYEATVDLARRAFDHPEDAPPERVPEELIQAILAARQSRG
jgi:anti-sigma factor RsiW